MCTKGRSLRSRKVQPLGTLCYEILIPLPQLKDGMNYLGLCCLDHLLPRQYYVADEMHHRKCAQLTTFAYGVDIYNSFSYYMCIA